MSTDNPFAYGGAVSVGAGVLVYLLVAWSTQSWRLDRGERQAKQERAERQRRLQERRRYRK